MASGAGFRIERLLGHWLGRYGLAAVLFGLTLGFSLLLTRNGIRINLTIPVVLALVAAAWYGGRGPGLLISVLFQGTTILYATRPPETSAAQAWFGYFSVFCLYVFIVLVISGLRRTQQRLAEQRDLLQVTLTSIGDAVITTDTAGTVTFLNPAAEKLTGWGAAEGLGHGLNEVFQIVNEDTRETVDNPVNCVLATGSVVGLANHTILIAKGGKETPIDDSAAPIRDRGTVKGVVLVFSDVTERKEAEKAKRETEIMHRIVEAQESERRRIARDLHDHLGQRMTALRLRIEMLTKECSQVPALTEAIGQLQESAVQIDRDIGFLSWELRPTELENLGLEDALSSFVREWSKQYGINADFHITQANLSGNVRMSHTVETNLYRITQEALNNVLKHAEAKNVNVLLQHRPDELVLIIEDDGRGFETAEHSSTSSSPEALGILGMRERAALLKGDLDLDTNPGTGTTVHVRIPTAAAA